MIVLREAAYPAAPWKNGGGTTREIHREPSGAVDFDWRLSLATIDRSGPFSSFPGHARTLVLVGGAGVDLSFGVHGQATLRAPGDQASFDGAWPTDCVLRAGPSTDLNLIVSKDRTEANSRCVRLSGAAGAMSIEHIATVDWQQTLVCCVSGRVCLVNSAGTRTELAAVDVARCFPSDGLVTCEPASTALTHVFIAGVRNLHRDRPLRPLEAHPKNPLARKPRSALLEGVQAVRAGRQVAPGAELKSPRAK